MKYPELVIREDKDGIPIAGGCSACPLVRFDLALISGKEEHILMLRAMFEIHFRKVHLPEGDSAPPLIVLSNRPT